MASANSKPGSPEALNGAAVDSTIGSHRFTFLGLSSAVIAVVASMMWMGVSSGLIMLNKDLLSNGFPYPMALSGMGMAFSAVASYFACCQLHLVEAKRSITPQFYFMKFLPVGFFTAMTLMLGNLVYLHLTVAFIQILKSFTPVITMIALFVARLETPTRRLILSVLAITLGTTFASIGELNFSILGVLIMLLAETFEAVRLVMTQVLLTGLKFHPIEGLMYLAPACTFWLFLGSLLVELRPMIANNAFSFVASHPIKFSCAAMMGFGVNSLAYVIIQVASSLTLKVLGTVKNAFVVWLGIFFLHEKMTLIQGVGYAISIGAFFVYQKIKMEQISTSSGDLARGDSGGKYARVSTTADIIDGVRGK